MKNREPETLKKLKINSWKNCIRVLEKRKAELEAEIAKFNEKISELENA